MDICTFDLCTHPDMRKLCMRWRDGHSSGLTDFTPRDVRPDILIFSRHLVHAWTSLIPCLLIFCDSPKIRIATCDCGQRKLIWTSKKSQTSSMSNLNTGTSRLIRKSHGKNPFISANFDFSVRIHTGTHASWVVFFFQISRKFGLSMFELNRTNLCLPPGVNPDFL